MNTLIGLGIALFAGAILYAIAMCKRSKKEQPEQPKKVSNPKWQDDEGNIYQ